MGVVIGVADLILPDNNIGEVGRQTCSTFPTLVLMKIADTFSLFFLCVCVVDGGKDL